MNSNYLVITGASKGIGKSTAMLFQQEGWTIINISRSHCDLPGVSNFLIDLEQADWQATHTVELRQHTKNANKICLVHNAALYYKDDISGISPQQLRKMLEVNLVAPAILNSIFIPNMHPGSSIIFIGSTLSEKAVKNAASYVTVKHALAGMMKATCQDLEGTSIHTTCVCPGFTDTEMLHAHLSNEPTTIDAIKTLNAAKRLVQPEEIASVILFCANNPVLNGAVLHANLGQIEK